MKGFGIVAVAALLASGPAGVGAGPVWVGTWAASQQVADGPNSLPSDVTKDVTLRETVHVSCGGAVMRVHLSNSFGARALHVTSAHVARPASSGSSAIDPATDRRLLFHGSGDVLIPPGAEYVSDPLEYRLGALSDLAISLHVEGDAGQQTGHPGSRQTTFYATGDETAAAEMSGAKKVDHWYLLSGVDVQAGAEAGAVVALGDSITDGHGATTNGNDRWTDVLAQRLRGRAIGVLNEGIGGNHLLTDGVGPNVLARVERDVLAQPGARWVIVFEGINDLGGLERTGTATQKDRDALVQRMTGAYEQVIARAHARGMKVFGATILADGGSEYYHPGAESENDRQRVNAWIRERGHFDAVIDFDKVTADPARPGRLLGAFDSGDHLHPGPAGYRAMADAVDLALFR